MVALPAPAPAETFAKPTFGPPPVGPGPTWMTSDFHDDRWVLSKLDQGVRNLDFKTIAPNYRLLCKYFL